MLNFFDSVSCETIIAENEAYEQVLAMVRLLYDNVVEGEYHEFTVVTDTLITGKKRVRIYY